MLTSKGNDSENSAQEMSALSLLYLIVTQVKPQNVFCS